MENIASCSNTKRQISRNHKTKVNKTSLNNSKPYLDPFLSIKCVINGSSEPKFWINVEKIKKYPSNPDFANFVRQNCGPGAQKSKSS